MKTRLFQAFCAFALLACLTKTAAWGSETGSTGGAQPIDNEQPTVQMRYIICYQGILPSPTGGSTGGDEEPMLGEIRAFAGDFIPGQWKECNGEELSITEHSALFSILGTTFGGNGMTTFALPDLRGRVPVGKSASLPLGTVTGTVQETLTEGQLPGHVHSIPGAATESTGGGDEINNIQPSLALTCMLAKDVTFAYMGEIRFFAGNFVPQAWIACEGQILNINVNTALFAKLGTYFGGNGTTTFGIPDLRGRTPIGLGTGPGLTPRDIGHVVGAETVTLGTDQLPSHSHTTGGDATGLTGSGVAVNNMQPSLVLLMGVRHVGVFPTTSGGGDGQFIGDVRFFAFNTFALENQLGTTWKLASGAVIGVESGDAYHLIVGNIYGGNGTTTVGLPDGRGRGIKGASVSADMGDLEGTESYNLSVDQMPAHTHTVATVGFSAATYSVNQGATSVTLTLNRTDTTTAAAITVVTNDGTGSAVPPFSAATAPTDYTDLDGTTGLVEFDVGQATKTVNVTLIPKTPTTTPNKRFTATLAYPNAVVAGAVNTATIQILANDTLKPTLTVTAPAAAATTVSASSPYLVKGTAGDAKGIDRVTVKLNDEDPVNAVLGAATANTSRPFSLEIEPEEGANTLVVTAYDLRGNNISVTRNFNFTLRYTLTVNRVAPVGVALDTAGTLALTATPSTAGTVLAPSTANANPKTSSIVPGTVVKLTATAKAGYFFSHWDYAPAGATYTGHILTFTMPSEDLPDLTAHFVANPFFAPAGAGTTFYGLIRPDAGVDTSNSSVGFFTGGLTATNGLFSGKVLMEGITKSFIFYFYGNGYGLFNVGTTKQPTLDLGGGKSLSFYYSDADDTIVATVEHGGVVKEADGSIAGAPPATTSTGIARRALYSATNLVPGAFLNQTVPATAPAPNKGFFTGFVETDVQSPTMELSTYPQGTGLVTLTLSNQGVVTFSGTLADGSTVTGSSGLVTGNLCPFFVQLTTPGGTAKGGSFSGLLTFDTTPSNADLYGYGLLWVRPAVTAVTSPAAAAAATNLYTDGWPNGISAHMLGALYNKDLTVQTSIGLGPVNATYGNADLAFGNSYLGPAGKLTSTIVKTNLNISGNTVTKIPTTDASFTLSVMASTGTFSGTFTPNWPMPATTKPSFKGIIYQKGITKGGYGFFISNAKNDLDPESGFVELTAEFLE